MGSEQEYGGAVSYYLDIQSLASLVRSKRGAQGLRTVSEECHISTSTISRVEREQVPDISSFLLLCDWLEISPARLFKDSAMEEQQGEGELPMSKADELALKVRADSRLEPATANVLAVLIKAAYKISAEMRN